MSEWLMGQRHDRALLGGERADDTRRTAPTQATEGAAPRRRGTWSRMFGGLGRGMVRGGAVLSGDTHSAGSGLSGAAGVVGAVRDANTVADDFGTAVETAGAAVGEEGIPEGVGEAAGAIGTRLGGIVPVGSLIEGTRDIGTITQAAGRAMMDAAGETPQDVAALPRMIYENRAQDFRGDLQTRREGGELPRGQLFRKAVSTAIGAKKLGDAVGATGHRPAYEYPMATSAAINRRTIGRAVQGDGSAPVTDAPIDGAAPAGSAAMPRTAAERTAPFAKITRGMEGLGKVLDGSTDGQEALAEGNNALAATQAAGVIGRGAAKTAIAGAFSGLATPMGGYLAGQAAEATLNAGGLALEGAGRGLGHVTGVEAAAQAKDARKAHNRHFFGDKNSTATAPRAVASPTDAPTSRADEVRLRGMRFREPTDGSIRGDREAGLPEKDYGNGFVNFARNRGGEVGGRQVSSTFGRLARAWGAGRAWWNRRRASEPQVAGPAPRADLLQANAAAMPAGRAHAALQREEGMRQLPTLGAGRERARARDEHFGFDGLDEEFGFGDEGEQFGFGDLAP